MTDLTLEDIRTVLQTELAPIRTKLNGLPLIHRSIGEIRQELRMVRAAINDIAKTNITSGEVEALHDDVNRLQDRQNELEARLLTLEETTK
jgi:ubiquinone biosynthesis protein UbiJ